MTDKIEDDFFTADHERLARIADAAKVFAWIAFIVNILLVGAKIIEIQNSYNLQAIRLGQIPDFWGMMSEKPLYAISIFVDILSILLRGIVYGLVLKGVSLGLNMIIDIDLDSKEKSQEASND
jgi:hypothetical protein